MFFLNFETDMPTCLCLKKEDSPKKVSDSKGKFQGHQKYQGFNTHTLFFFLWQNFGSQEVSQMAYIESNKCITFFEQKNTPKTVGISEKH